MLLLHNRCRCISVQDCGVCEYWTNLYNELVLMNLYCYGKPRRVELCHVEPRRGKAGICSAKCLPTRGSLTICPRLAPWCLYKEGNMSRKLPPKHCVQKKTLEKGDATREGSFWLSLTKWLLMTRPTCTTACKPAIACFCRLFFPNSKPAKAYSVEQ